MSETFSAEWLALREPVDHRSRPAELVGRLAEWCARRSRLRVLDLGCGTGSNVRYLAPKLPAVQEWTLLDRDEALLARVEAPVGTSVRPLRGTLEAEGLAEVAGADAVTASALLDLVSDTWLGALADACEKGGCAALFALTYDGTFEWLDGGDPVDAAVRDAVNAHQRRDKGLGPALGPAAARRAEALFGERGYRTWLSASPWVLGPEDAALVRSLIEGWASAAAEQRPEEADRVRAWAERRRAGSTGQHSRLVVGHLDLLALPREG